jgi:hypothetical protein
MRTTLRILTLIAFLLAALQVADLAIHLITPPQTRNDQWAAQFATRAFYTWAVHWPAGVVLYCIGVLLGKRSSLLATSSALAGAYMMLLGNHGGFWANGFEDLRIITSITTFAIFGVTAYVFDRNTETRNAEQSLAAESR